jgi:hypothetical protein
MAANLRLIVLVTLGLGPSTAGGAPGPADLEFFEKRIRPVLVDHCHGCHSAAAGKSKGGLRLDRRDAILRGGDSGPAVVPGAPEKSRLIAAVRYDDVDLQMPPRGKLPASAIADLEAWIGAGANWPDEAGGDIGAPIDFDLRARKAAHWCWQPIRPPAPPPGDGDPIDRFILSRLDAAGLRPSPPAPPPAVLRRVHFDLTGLPPAPELLDELATATDPRAKLAELVDRLLSSPRFGERWARHWLDLMRYAETRGHEFDYATPNAWQYRDYVIRALNDDVPYDQFVREHVAGDLLPSPRRDPAGRNESIIATGFWWLGEQVHSPVDLRQDEADRVDNQIDVFGKAFLGLTIACARCHDHKFDAISTRDYYSLASVLASSGYRQYRFETDAAETAAAERLQRGRRDRLARTRSELGQLALKVIDTSPIRVPGAAARRADERVIVDYSFADEQDWMPDGVGMVRVRPGDVLAGVAIEAAAAADPAFFELPVDKSAQSDPGDLGKYRRSGRSVRTPSVVLDGRRIYFRARGKGVAYVATNWYAMFEGPLHRHLVQRFDAGPSFRWLAVDTSRYADHRAHVELTPLSADFAVSQVVLADRMPDEPATVIVDADGQRKAVERFSGAAVVSPVDAAVVSALLTRSGSEAQELLDRLIESDRAAAVVKPSQLANAMWDGSAHTSRVAIRGNPKVAGAPAPRRLPEALAGPSELPMPGSGRLAIAEQLTSPGNPLLARVFVNRVWQRLMGRGIVASTDNFGVLGDAPTHPELLDHLADSFVRDGWKVKRLIRRIVLTRAYQQSSTPRPDAGVADPDNRLYHRAYLKRLEGEAIRDTLLTLSGRLDTTMFGPPIPVHLTRFMDGRGRPGTSGPVDGAGRRSIYLEVRRNFLNPFFLAFDTPPPASPVGRRTQSNVPAQALVLLNDTFVRRQAELWADRTTGDPDARIVALYRAAFARPPSEAELAACRQFADRMGWHDLAHALVNKKEFIYVH